VEAVKNLWGGWWDSNPRPLEPQSETSGEPKGKSLTGYSNSRVRQQAGTRFPARTGTEPVQCIHLRASLSGLAITRPGNAPHELRQKAPWSPATVRRRFGSRIRDIHRRYLSRGDGRSGRCASFLPDCLGVARVSGGPAMHNGGRSIARSEGRVSCSRSIGGHARGARTRGTVHVHGSRCTATRHQLNSWLLSD